MENEINISNRNKAEVLAMLYNKAKPQGLGLIHFTPEHMTTKEAQEILDSGQTYFDYVKGRVMKVDLSGDTFSPCLYDRDNGEGSALRAIGE